MVVGFGGSVRCGDLEGVDCVEKGKRVFEKVHALGGRGCEALGGGICLPVR